MLGIICCYVIDIVYFVIKTKTQLFGTPLNDKGELSPINKMLIDPVQYYKQQNRLNK